MCLDALNRDGQSTTSTPMQARERQLSCSQASSRMLTLQMLQDGGIRASTEGTVNRHSNHQAPGVKSQAGKQGARKEDATCTSSTEVGRRRVPEEGCRRGRSFGREQRQGREQETRAPASAENRRRVPEEGCRKEGHNQRPEARWQTAGQRERGGRWLSEQIRTGSIGWLGRWGEPISAGAPESVTGWGGTKRAGGEGGVGPRCRWGSAGGEGGVVWRAGGRAGGLGGEAEGGSGWRAEGRSSPEWRASGGGGPVVTQVEAK